MDQDMDLHPRDPSINHFPRSTVSDPRPSTSLPPHHGSSCPSAMLELPQAARSLSHLRPPWGVPIEILVVFSASQAQLLSRVRKVPSRVQWRIRASAFISRCRQIAEWVPIVSSAVEFTWSCSTRQHLPQDNKQRRFLAGFYRLRFPQPFHLICPDFVWPPFQACPGIDSRPSNMIVPDDWTAGRCPATKTTTAPCLDEVLSIPVLLRTHITKAAEKSWAHRLSAASSGVTSHGDTRASTDLLCLPRRER